ncbi:MAG TPA: hypothetical protein VFO91_20090 [Anaerolineales bacterium]|nr:hypothetical protein [Anaerolineales bacterium]
MEGSPAMNGAGQNPYVGPRTFRTDERNLFFGREREALDLLSLVISERLVLFYAQSGAGKSSLINAKLIPGLLAEEEYRVLPIGRGGGSLSALDVDNIYIYNLISSLLQHDIGQDVLSKLTLTKFLARLGIDINPSLKQVLIIDQFEELFSTYQEAWMKREDFFRQLARAMQNYPNLWVVLVMREDYIAYLDPYVHLLPGRLRVRYYMQRLSHEAAIEAVKQPAARAKRPFARGVAEKLVNDLSSVKVRRPDDTLETQIGQYVEPVQLQVVCSSLWEKLPEDGGRITQEHLDQYVGDVNQALGNYYNERVRAVAEGEEAKTRGVKERDIRAWFGSRLITADGYRNLVAQEPGGTSGGLDDDVVQEFVKRGDLVRAETRGSVTFYELTHDRLIEPILADNRKWEEEHTSVLQRQAALWDQQGRSEGLLLRGQDLANIEETVSTSELTKVEQDFLQACRKLRAQEERERTQRYLITMFSVVATIAFLLALFFGIQSSRNAQQLQTASTQVVEERNQAQDLAQVGLAHQLVQESRAQLNNRYVLSLLLGVEAYRRRPDLPEARSNLLANLNSPNLIRFLDAHRGAVNSVALSSDGRLMASGSDDDTIILWDVSNPGSPVQLGDPVSAHAEGVSTVAFSPDSQMLASGSLREIILWDISDPASPEQLGKPFSGHTRFVEDLAFSSDGRMLVSGSNDATIILWNISDPGSPVQIGEPLAAHREAVTSLALSPDDEMLASGSEDDTIILWDISDPNAPEQLGDPLSEHSDDVESVAFHPEGRILASGSQDSTVILWDVEVAEPFSRPLSGHANWVESVAFSPDGDTLASGSADKTIRLWDVSDPSSPRLQGGPLAGHTSSVEEVAFHADGKTLASGSADKTIRLWDASNPKAPNQLGAPLFDTNDVKSVAFSPDRKILASGGDDSILLWDISNPEQPVQLGAIGPGQAGNMESIAFSADSQILASGGEDLTIILWDISDPRSPTPLGAPLSGHTETVQELAFSPDRQLLASGSEDDTIILWDVSDPGSPRQLSAPLTAHTDDVQSVAFSPDSRILASGGDDDTIILWDLSNPESPSPFGAPLSAHTDDIKSVSFHPDGGILASGSDDSTIILWDISNPQSPIQLGAPLSAHTEAVQTVAFSQDRKTLASAGEDNMIILWDVTDPQLPIELGAPLSGHSDSVESVAFHPDGKLLASGGQDFTVRLWEIDAESWRNRTCAFVGRDLTEAEWQRYLPNQEYLTTCSSPTIPAPTPAGVSTSPPATSIATAQATPTAEVAPVASPIPQVSPTAQASATAGTSSSVPLLTGAVTSCDPSTNSINFRMVESPPDLTDSDLVVLIADQEAACDVNPVNPSLLTCTITPPLSFPVRVIVHLDGVQVNSFSYPGEGCPLNATPTP